MARRQARRSFENTQSSILVVHEGRGKNKQERDEDNLRVMQGLAALPPPAAETGRISPSSERRLEKDKHLPSFHSYNLERCVGNRSKYCWNPHGVSSPGCIQLGLLEELRSASRASQPCTRSACTLLEARAPPPGAAQAQNPCSTREKSVRGKVLSSPSLSCFTLTTGAHREFGSLQRLMWSYGSI